METGILFCDYFRDLRTKKGISIREFCKRNELDWGNVSKIERGVVPPPASEDVLRRYAHALGLQEDSEEWRNFFDLACAQNGRIPYDLRNNENLVASLPVFFRTLRGGGKLTEDQFKQLVEQMKAQSENAQS